jgi:hypothetical protein
LQTLKIIFGADKLKNELKVIEQIEARTANRRLAKKRVQWLIEALCFESSSVLKESLVLRNPLLRQAPKRYVGLPIPEKYPKIYFEIIPIFGMFAKISCYE